MENQVPSSEAPKKGMGISTIIILVILGVVVLSFIVEGIGALHEGRPLNLELINKLLDTLMSLMQSTSPSPVEQ